MAGWLAASAASATSLRNTIAWAKAARRKVLTSWLPPLPTGQVLQARLDRGVV
jgi:hypothetical protein